MSSNKIQIAKEYLQKIYKADCEINNLIAEKMSYRDLAEKITQTVGNEQVQSSGTKDKIGELAVKISDKEYEISEKIELLFALKQKVCNEIKMLENEKYKRILILRYICFMKFDEIASEMKIDLRWTYRLNNKALEAFADILSESDKS